jgi:UDP-N-acetylmuramoyl-L-alanyl-D-glutamate--2,6-diaminopimelate ligase
MAELHELLGSDGASAPRGVTITSIAIDNRKAVPGSVFFALAGSRTDGGRFAADAAGKGALAVVGEGERPAGLPANVAFIRVADARATLARAAAKLHPRQPETIVAVTGTNGKTSVVSFTRQIWAAAGHKAASLGTLGVSAPSGEVTGSLTTPDPVALHELLDKLAGEGVTHLALEASSHGLDQRRLDGVRISAGAFTNLTRDHLDYHPTLEAYRTAKLRLFDTLLPEGASAVINADSPEARIIAAVAQQMKLRLISVGSAGGKDYRLHLPLVGAFQASNALVAAGLAIATGVATDEALAALEDLEGAAGRLEYVGKKGNAPIFVDYAHTPDALGNALDALRPFAAGQLLVVFGAGGDRDPGKRPLMGAVAARRADRAFVTDDNPRSEDPAAIRKAILASAPDAIEIGDRAAAIAAAVEELKAGDVLLVAGKGHETGQILGDRTLPFSDQAAVRAALGGKR